MGAEPPFQEEAPEPYVFGLADKIVMTIMTLVGATCGGLWGIGFQMFFTRQPSWIFAAFTGLLLGAALPYAGYRRYSYQRTISKWIQSFGPVIFCLALIPLMFAGFDFFVNRSHFAWKTSLFAGSVVILAELLRRPATYVAEKLILRKPIED